MEEKTLDIEMSKKEVEIILNWWELYESEHGSTESERNLAGVLKYALEAF